MSYVWHNYVGPALGKNECLRFAHSIVITDTAHPSQVPVIDSDNSWCDLWCVGTYVSGAVITLSRYFLLIGPHCDFSGGFEVRFQCNVMNTITFKCQYEQIRTVNTYHINPHIFSLQMLPIQELFWHRRRRAVETLQQCFGADLLLPADTPLAELERLVEDAQTESQAAVWRWKFLPASCWSFYIHIFALDRT